MKSLSNYIHETLYGSKLKYNGSNKEFVDCIIENNDGMILILRRANYMRNFRTCWCLPGGNIDENDKNLKYAIIREVREETGIEINAADEIHLKELFEYEYRNGNITHVFYIKLNDNITVKLSSEHSKYEWIDLSSEKIDDRKWVPEVFNILQKWEAECINEVLRINKNYKTFDKIFNDAIDHYVSLINNIKIDDEQILYRNIEKYFYHVLSYHSINDDDLDDKSSMIIDMMYKQLTLPVYEFTSK